MTLENKDLNNFEKVILDHIRSNPLFKEQILKTINQNDEESFPLSLITIKQLANLEALVKYLRENKDLSYKEIGQKLNRKPNTLAVVYKNAKLKMQEPFKNLDDSTVIPYTAFSNDELSILESIVYYFQCQGKKQIQIAKLIERDSRTIWTINKRIKDKIKK